MSDTDGIWTWLRMGEKRMIEIGTGKTLRRLDEMLTDAMNGTFEESRYDESELSRLESRWKQYFTTSKMSVEQTKKERESMKKLVSDISHQTRTPLSNILLYSELLAEQAEKEEERELARQILTQTEKLEFLIQSLIKMSRLETDVLEVVPRVQNIAPLLSETVREMSAKASKKKITISCEDAKEIEAAFDLKWTKEALENILDNAIKYSPKESAVKIEVRKYEFYVCINVKDQGIGIREEEKAQIFHRFYRGRQVQQEDGAGIGLYLAREILQKENGYIKLTSKWGEGSCFGVYLPKRISKKDSAR